MRILLVKAASLNKEVPQVSPPLGLMYIAASLKSRTPGHEQVILDLTCTPRPQVALQAELRRLDPEVVGISALTPEAGTLHLAARAAKEHNASTVVVVGGAHASACPKSVAADPHVDAVVFGEGEATYVELIERLSRGQTLEGLPGAAWREDAQMRKGPPRPLIEDLDSLPFPAWDLIGLHAYARRGRAGNLPRRPYMALFTSRGCPFQCPYCHRVFGKKYRVRSVSNVIAEIEELNRRFGIRDFQIFDDAFNLDLPRAKEICRRLVGKGYSFSFPNGVRSDRLDRELVRLLARMGTTNLAIAVDTASPERQRALGRNLDLERVREAIEWANEEGITTVGYFMLGFPHETRGEMEHTIRFAVESRLLFASFFIVTPYPGTPLWEATFPCEPSEEIDYGSLVVFTGLYNLSAVSNRELRATQRAAYVRFYARRLLRIARAAPRLNVDWRNAAWIGFRRLVDRGMKLREAG